MCTTRSGWNVISNEITFWWGICKAKYDDIHAHSLLTSAKKNLKNLFILRLHIQVSYVRDWRKNRYNGNSFWKWNRIAFLTIKVIRLTDCRINSLSVKSYFTCTSCIFHRNRFLEDLLKRYSFLCDRYFSFRNSAECLILKS